MAEQRSLISAGLTCVEQRCCQRAGRRWSVNIWCLTNEEGYAALSLYGEGVVQVSIQVAHQNFGFCQAHIGWLIVDFFTARLAHEPLASLAFDVIGDVRSTTCVLWWAPREKEFSCTVGSQEVTWCRGEPWHKWIGKWTETWTRVHELEASWLSIQSEFFFIVSVISLALTGILYLNRVQSGGLLGPGRIPPCRDNTKPRSLAFGC